MAAVLIQIDGYDPVAGAAVSLRASSVDDERVCHLDAKTWWPALGELPALRYELFEGGFSGEIRTPSSTLVLATEPWPHFARYSLADARVRIWTGEEGAAWAAWTLRFDGRALAQPAVAEGLAKLTIAVDDRWLDAPLLATYAGTGGAEGEPALKGQPKPLALGAPRYAPGRLIDSAKSIVQLNAYGEIEAVEAAMERLALFGASVGDYASHAALAAATIPAGAWATSRAAGMVRHGAPPVGRLSYQLKGDKASAEGWVRLPGSMIRRVAALAGGAAKVDDSSLTALNGARPWNLSIYQGDQVTARVLIQRIAASVNAVAGVSWLGKLFVIPIGFGAPTLTLDATGAALPPVASVEQLAVDPPWWRLSIESEKTWEVHPLGDIAFNAVLVDRGNYVAGETYREGHVVQHQNSTWLYINPAPTFGNAPPTLPTTSNLYWRVLARAGQNGAAGRVAYLLPAFPQFPANGAGTITNNAIAVQLLQENFTTAEAAAATWTATAYAGASAAAMPLRIGSGTSALYTAGPGPVYVHPSDFPAGLTATTAVQVFATIGGVQRTTVITKTKDGANGLSIAEVTCYQRAAAVPAVPAGGSYDFATKVLSPPAGWSAQPPAGTQPLYAATGTAAVQALSGTVTPTWAGVGRIAQDGAVGADGAAVDIIFTRSAAQPATPAASAAAPAGWYSDHASVPASANPLWSSFGQRAGGASSYTWDTPARVEGAAGQNNATVWLYQRAAAAPPLPTGTFTYTFSTRELTGGVPAGWSQSIPAGNEPIWVTAAGASATSATDTIGTGEWAAAQILSGAGISAATVQLFRREALPTVPPVPSAPTTYTFATGVLTGITNGWSQTIPADTAGGFLFVTTAMALGTTATDSIASSEWATPRILSKDGEDGENGEDGHSTATRFKRSIAQPATPTGNEPISWSAGVPSGTEAIWQSQALRTRAGVLVGVWSTPQKVTALNPRGAYSSTATYYPDDTVTHAGGTYKALQGGFSGQAPSGTGQATAYWEVVAAPGATGAPASPPGTFSTTITIAGSSTGVNLRSLADAAGYTGNGAATITFNVTANITALPGGRAIDTGSWPSTSHAISLTLNISAGVTVAGGGGAGGAAPYSPGGTGGDGVFCQEALTINNGGALRGGGGGGGGGHGQAITPPMQQQSVDDPYAGGGGGGGGAPNGPGGLGEPGYNGGASGANGSAGTASGGGAGGTGNVGGAAGGAFGAAGVTSSGAGGAAGFAVRRNGRTTNAANGTYSGSWA